MISILCCVLVGCSPAKEKEKSIDDIIVYNGLYSKAAFELFWNYGSDNNITKITVTSKKAIGENEYECHGYVTVRDVYGDIYKAKYDAVVVIEEDEKCECISFNMETPRKQ